MVGQAVREARRRKGLTQAQLAAAVGLTRQHVNNIEQGKGDIPVSTVVKLARALDMTEIRIDDGLLLRRLDQLDALDSLVARINDDAAEFRSWIRRSRDDVKGHVDGEKEAKRK